MPKKIFALVVMSVLLAATLLGPAAHAVDYAEGVVNASDVNIRAKAGTDAASVGKLAKDQKVAIISEANGWMQISTTSGKSLAGFVKKDYITKTGKKITAAAATPTPAPAQNQQTSATASAAPEATPTPTPEPAKPGIQFQNILSSGNDATPTPSPVNTAPLSSEVSSQAASATASPDAANLAATPSPSQGLSDKIVIVTAKDVRVRDKASSKGKTLGKVGKETVLPLLSEELFSKEYYKVSYNDKEGYISKKYCKLGSTNPIIKSLTLEWAPPASIPAANITDEERAVWSSIPQKIAEAKAKNTDVIGWVRVPNTNVDYPVVIASNNEYYLGRNATKASDKAGAIYMDYRNNAADQRKHMVVYGHNMRVSKIMFNHLQINYPNKEFFDANRVVRVDVFGATEWEVFSIHYEPGTDTKFIKTNFNTDDEFLQYCKQLSDRSLFNTGLSFSKNDQILSLVTCGVTSAENRRFYTHLRRIK